ncbi:stage III sporulation protein AE [Niameybacter massiliensis]|uniref:Stage III sporulation protein AE n=1 Tax=Holtiella tumoricola TaxID=3018743 RepID=A0AA42J2L3_9FIRM|nr:stage III sporulation protein AE [Holtiella tumoricola]MDA3733772.1 stage III sporulation protein AE [Holtiella tumoricola]
MLKKIRIPVLVLLLFFCFTMPIQAFSDEVDEESWISQQEEAFKIEDPFTQEEVEAVEEKGQEKAAQGSVEIVETFSEEQIQSVLKQQFDILNWGEIESLEEELKQSVPYLEDFDLSSQVLKLISGEERFSIQEVMAQIGQLFVNEFNTYFKIIIRFILIVILCSILQILSKSFQSQNTAKAAYLVCYILVIFTLSQSLMMLVQVAQKTITQLYEIMQVTLPTLLAFMAVSGYITSSSALAPVIIGTFNIMTFIIQKLVLPMLVAVIVLHVVSTMSEEIKVDKFIDLFYKGIRWGLRGIIVISVAIMGIYKMTLPYIDVALKKGAINVSTAFLPIIGDASKGAIEFILSCSALIKNAFAIGVIIWVVLIAAIPLMKIFIHVIMYNVVGALIQPLGDKKMTEIAGVLAKGCEFILSAVGVVVVLTIASMIICASIGMSMT